MRFLVTDDVPVRGNLLPGSDPDEVTAGVSRDPHREMPFSRVVGPG
jgi:hypothetical protein